MQQLLSALALVTSFSALQAEPQNAMIHLRVTVMNGTAGNALSPFVVALHDSSSSLFQVGMPASPGLARIAETGDSSVLESELDQSMTSLGHFKAPGAPIMAGESRSVEFMVPMSSKARLSLVAMIGRSNDSFIALRDFDLSRLKTSMSLHAQNFDAGSEENSGNVEDFGSGGHPTAQAESKVSYDRGLNPRGNAPETWGWGPVAATVTIEVLP